MAAWVPWSLAHADARRSTQDLRPRGETQQAYEALPLVFVPSEGQLGGSRFHERGPGHAASFGPSGLEVALSRRGAKDIDRFRLFPQGAASPLQITPEGLHPGRVNYLIGKDRSRWRTNLPAYQALVYRDVYPGVDIRFYGSQQQLEYDVVLAPGADPARVRLAVEGARGLRLLDGGDLSIELREGRLVQKAPVLHQTIDGRRMDVKGRFRLLSPPRGERAGSVMTFGFDVGAYDHRHPLVIDPVLFYSSYLGGSGSDSGFAIVVRGDGTFFAAGETASANFDTTADALDTSANGNVDAWIARFDITQSGSASLAYSTYFGGQSAEGAVGLEVDADGNPHLTGYTDSSDFPTSSGAFDTTQNGGRDAFLAKLSAAGDTLLYSTVLGSGGTDQGLDLGLDASGAAYVTGFSTSAAFPTTAGAFDVSHNGGRDAFVAKINPAGLGADDLVYSTFLGGSSDDQGNGIDVTSAGIAYVVGQTEGDGFPSTANAFDTTHHSGLDVFLSVLNAQGSSLTYSTFVGHGGDDIGKGVSVDSGGRAYIVVQSHSNLPTTPGSFDTIQNGQQDGYVAKFDPARSGSASLIYATFLGGNKDDGVFGISVDDTGGVCVTGFTESNAFPTRNPVQANRAGNRDLFLTHINPAGTALTFSTYLGGGADDVGYGVDVLADKCCVVGTTSASNFPVSAEAFQLVNDGSSDACVFCVDGIIGACPAIAVSPATAAGGFVGVPYSEPFTQTGGEEPINWTRSGQLPPGLILDPLTGVLSGTPTTAGTFTFSVNATDANGCSGSQEYTVTIETCPAITIGPSTAPDGFVGVAYSVDFDSSGGVGSSTWSFTGTLPDGLSLDSSTGVLSGTPSQTGQFIFTIVATDENGCTGSQQYTVTIGTCPAITVDPATATNGFLGVAYSQQFTQTGGTGITWSFSGTLPDGLTLDSSGLLSGTPTATGTFNFTIIATATGGCSGSTDYSVTIGVPTPFALDVDTAGNSVFEPNETVIVAPHWLNPVAGVSVDVTGSASNFVGPAGAPHQTYTIVDGTADYGTIAALASSSCATTGNCYSFGNTATNRPLLHWDTTFVEDPSVGSNKTWTLHIGDSFTDAPTSHIFYRFIETIFHHGITSGCGATGYCPDSPNTRGQMAVFLLRSKLGKGYVPPPAIGIFSDVPTNHQFAAFIEDLFNRGITSGCSTSPLAYCPEATVTRGQMAVFLLRTLLGNGYAPPAPTGVFDDVPVNDPFAAFIEDLAARAITSGCNTNPPLYCPAAPNTRGQMAVFLTRTFSLILYGP
jgi:hypothetical protein